MFTMSKFETFTETLLEGNYSDLKKKLGGAPIAGNVSEVVGKKFVDSISIMRELDIEIAHFNNLVEAASKVVPAIPAVVSELKKAHKAMINSQTAIAKAVKNVDIVMPNGKLKKK